MAMANDYNAMAKDYRSQFFKLKKTSKNIAKKAAVSTSAHGQTFLLMIILSSTYLVQEEIETANIKKEDISEVELLPLVNKVTKKIINSPEIWSSLIGSIALVEFSNKAFSLAKHSKAAKQFQKQLAHNSQLRKLFFTFLKNSIMANITFIGWDFGGSLFKMARDSLADDADYDKAANISTLFANKDVFKKIFSQIYTILIENEETRTLLFWNLFRNKILTGDFATLVASMSTAITAGSIIFPGGGSALGFLFGLVGGGIYLMIPQDAKDSLTTIFQGLREKFWLSGESGKRWFQYSNALETVIRISSETINNNKTMPPMLSFPRLEESTNKVLTIHFEKAYKYETQLQLISDKLELSYKHNNQEYIDLYTRKRDEIQSSYLENLSSMESYMQDKLDEIVSLLKRYPIDFYDSKLSEKYPMISKIKEYIYNIKAQLYFIKDLNSTIKLELDLEQDKKTYFLFLFEQYFYGYEQDKVLEVITN